MRKLVDAVGIMGAIKMLSTLDDKDYEYHKKYFFCWLSQGHSQEEITIEFLRVFGD